MNTIHIHLPPLRDRTDDIPVLADFFLDRHVRKYRKQGMYIREDAMAKLKRHNWPGNIRELEHALEKAVILTEREEIRADDLYFGPTAGAETVPDTLEEMEQRMIESALQKNGHNLSAAAAQLGITRQTLYNKLKKYGL
jgi:DNA-binding NtrC family response regulator